MSEQKAGVGSSGRQPYRGLSHQSHCSCSYELERLQAERTAFMGQGAYSHFQEMEADNKHLRAVVDAQARVVQAARYIEECGWQDATREALLEALRHMPYSPQLGQGESDA